MKVIDIETGDIIEEYKSEPRIKYYTTRSHWDEYKKWCELMGEKQNKALYERFIKGRIDE